VAVHAQQYLALGPCHQRHVFRRIGPRSPRRERSSSARSYLLPASSRHIGMSIARAGRPPSQLGTLLVARRSRTRSSGDAVSGRAGAREGGWRADRKGDGG
jgi:hypothetical protein